MYPPIVRLCERHPELLDYDDVLSFMIDINEKKGCRRLVDNGFVSRSEVISFVYDRLLRWLEGKGLDYHEEWSLTEADGMGDTIEEIIMELS